MRKAAFYRVINSKLSADKFTADEQTSLQQTSKQGTSKQANKQTSRQADEQTSRQVHSRQADKFTADKFTADKFTADKQTRDKQTRGEADNVGADPCVRPPFCLCRICQGRHTGLPLQKRLQLAHNTSRYIMKSSKCGENDMRLIATRKGFLSNNLMSQLHNAM